MKIEDKIISSIRIHAVEAIEKANSGHPGLPLGAAPMAYTLWDKIMNFNPENPKWENRDRFILSAGHGSALLYSLLNTFGYDITKEDLMNFRQWGSKTPGHPEYGHTVGVEVTTGPLGQGIANGVGMAMAEAHLAQKFNREHFNVVDHYTYVLAGDGCMMEGIASEAASLAGTLGLGKLVVLYDSNNITIEGNTNIAFREDVAKRFEAYGWGVLKVEDGNDISALEKALMEAKEDGERPTLVVVNTTIGYGAPKQGTSGIHGSPLGDGMTCTKKFFQWEEEPFETCEEVREFTKEKKNQGVKKESSWNSMFSEYASKYPELAAEWKQWFSKEMPKLEEIEELWSYEKSVATRAASGTMINKLTQYIPNLFGGSADLAPSNNTNMKDKGDFSKEDRSGCNIHFGIREHAMAAIANGIVLHGGLRTFVATFFVFCDYMKPSMRLSALMKLPVVYILTHDSIGVGEDGPTHEPIEHLASLRSIPNFTVFRPADARETTAAWIAALNRNDGPTGIVLSRQSLPLLNGTGQNAFKGAYILNDSEKETPDMLLMASGSEVQLILEAQKQLKEKGIDARVISMPSFEVFEEQTEEYKESVMPKSVRKRMAVEAASSMGWHKYVGIDGKILSIDTFGASAPGEVLFDKFGFKTENIVAMATDEI
ncbi:transketolase [Hathewaya proteolytica DSM 3090]|uniref:Transketolase n=1 Tax=Hathewaya proteolytica DSM 3090 TaxID=1121331 RepID=A0A1M6N7P1_9CLOT|nr:transketolase [Hathewaya proteolytica]SHJ91758.1 transketolase [Hathewaya proteolytica DSM 3090]